MGPLGYYDKPLQIIFHQDLSAFKEQLRRVDINYDDTVKRLETSDKNNSIDYYYLQRRTSRWGLIENTISSTKIHKNSNNSCDVLSFINNLPEINESNDLLKCDENTYVLRNPDWDTSFKNIRKMGEEILLTPYPKFVQNSYYSEIEKKFQTLQRLMTKSGNLFDESLMPVGDLVNFLKQVRLSDDTHFPNFEIIHKLMTYNMTRMGDTIIFTVTIPRIKSHYQLYEMVPLPTKMCNASQFLFINPTARYLINNERDRSFYRIFQLDPFLQITLGG